jgi:hypothetical protein
MIFAGFYNRWPTCSALGKLNRLRVEGIAIDGVIGVLYLRASMSSELPTG